MAFLMSIRPLNLVIIGCTQILIYFLFFHSVDISAYGMNWVLSPPKIFIFTLVTICIAASGYLINDYVDFHSDISNEKKNRLQSQFANLKYYLLIVLVGFVISVLFALDMGKPLLSLIYLLAIGGLFIYSTHLKKTVLLGNIVVSIFSGGVLWILLYAENALMDKLPLDLEEHIRGTVWLFCIFAFLVSMIREIVKDVEDINGDKANGYKTLPIRYGIGWSKVISIFIVITLIASLGYLTYASMQEQQFLIGFYLIIALLLPLGWIGYSIWLPTFSERSRLISQYCKAVMLFGIILLILAH